MTGRHRSRLAALALGVAAWSSPAATGPAAAFGSVCSAVAEPWANPPCPVNDFQAQANTQGILDTENDILKKHQSWNQVQQTQTQTVGPQGQTNMGGPQPGMDMSNGQKPGGATSMQSMGSNLVNF